MIVSRLQNGHWKPGEHQEAVWSYSAKSDDWETALRAAKREFYPSGVYDKKVPVPEIEPGMYVLPDEFVPVSRASAECFGTRFYVGGPCLRHPLNHIRWAHNKACVVCSKMRDRGVDAV